MVGPALCFLGSTFTLGTALSQLINVFLYSRMMSIAASGLMVGTHI